MPFFVSKVQGNKKIVGNLTMVGYPRITDQDYLFKLKTASGDSAETPSGPVAGPTRKKLKILIDGVVYYFLAANDWVNAVSSSPSPSRSPSASLSPSASASASASPSHV